MPTVVIIDTSVFLNILDVPGFNQERDSVLAQLQAYFDDEGASLILPIYSIIETGNHIAHVADGRLRRRYATIFTEQVAEAVSGQAPWQPTQTIDLSKMMLWLAEFPDHAMREIGLADLAIVKDWEGACIMYPQHDVVIWSLDEHLSGYHREV